MYKVQKIGLTIIIIFILFFLTSFSGENILSKLKSISYIIKLVDNYYVEEVDLEQILDGAIHGLLEELDPHSSYIPAKESEIMNESIQGEFEGIGIEFAILDGYITVISPIPGTPSDRAGLQGGDKIVKINDESAYKITQDEVFKKLRGVKGSSVNITIQRLGLESSFDVTLVRDKIPIHSVIAALLYDNNLGYVKLNRFAKNTTKEFISAIDSLENIGMENLILDLRNNPGGLMDQAISLVDLFIYSNDTILFTKGRINEANEVFYATKNKQDYDFPIIALINRSSASASEIVSGALQDLDRGLVIGETSFGKGLVQRQFVLEDGSMTRITIAKYYTPAGRMIQRSYDEGLDEYYTNLLENNREASDSSLFNRPQFKTKKGRLVYGGGGITPDIYSVFDLKLKEKSQSLLTHPKRLIFKYANELKKDYEKFLSFNSFATFINKNTNVINQNIFIDWIKNSDEDFDISFSEIQDDWEYIENRIFAELASVLWGKDYYYHVFLDKDIQFQTAVQNISNAHNIMD